MRVTITSEPRLLHVLRGVVRHYAERVGFEGDEADRLCLAIDEAAANIIRHTYGNRRDGRLTLEVASFPDRLEFVLEDFGPKVQPEKIHHRPLDEVRPGGLGTLFIKTFVDACSYDESCREGNRLRLVKYLTGKVPAHEARGARRE